MSPRMQILRERAAIHGSITHVRLGCFSDSDTWITILMSNFQLTLNSLCVLKEYKSNGLKNGIVKVDMVGVKCNPRLLKTSRCGFYSYDSHWQWGLVELLKTTILLFI